MSKIEKYIINTLLFFTFYCIKFAIMAKVLYIRFEENREEQYYNSFYSSEITYDVDALQSELNYTIFGFGIILLFTTNWIVKIVNKSNLWVKLLVLVESEKYKYYKYSIIVFIAWILSILVRKSILYSIMHNYPALLEFIYKNELYRFL